MRDASNALPVEQSKHLPPVLSQTDEVKDTLEALRSELKEVRLKLTEMQAMGFQPTGGGNASESTQDNAALTKMIGDMTAELQAQIEAKKQLIAALKASERKIDELTRENDQMSKTQSSYDSADMKKNKKGVAAKSADTEDKGKVKDWKILGLSANRVVIQDKNGKIHNVGQGESLNGVKVNSVDLESGNIKTTAGTLLYGR